MVTYKIIESKQIFSNKTKSNYYVVLEVIEIFHHTIIQDHYVQEDSQGVKEIIKIYEDHGEGSSLKTDSIYEIGKRSIDDIMEIIQMEKNHIFQEEYSVI
jgi:hypothetical protein